LAEEYGGMPPIVAFANDWRTDPTSKHHVMRLLAEQADVLWVESSGMRAPSMARAGDLRRIIAKLGKMSGGVRRELPRLSVLSPPSLPLPTLPFARALNAHLYARSIDRTLAQLGRREPPILWVYTPTVARYLPRLGRSGLVYHCVDRWWAFEDYDADEMRACHEILCREADVVFASAKVLEEDCRQFTDRVVYLPHGVEWAHFRRAVTECPARPADLPAGPMAGFIGLIDTWVDQELLVAVARQLAPAHVVLIGHARVDVSRLEAEANIILLGRKPFDELPAYAAAFDVGLIPFEVNELTRAVNPIKLREYLSAGVPVVTTALPEILPFADRPGTIVVEDRGAFVAAVVERVAHPLAGAARRSISDSMANESWEGRVAEMRMALDRSLARQRGAA
jgi:glycosyltransferase involved in cell wall biosynthesis